MKPVILNHYSSISESDILQFEIEHGLVLPSDYRKWLLYNYGGDIDEIEFCFRLDTDKFPIPSFESDAVEIILFVRTLLPIYANEETLEWYYNFYKIEHQWLPHNMMPIGLQSDSSMVLLVYSDEENGAIYQWDYNHQYYGNWVDPPSEFPNIWKIADTFDEFLNGFVLLNEIDPDLYTLLHSV